MSSEEQNFPDDAFPIRIENIELHSIDLSTVDTKPRKVSSLIDERDDKKAYP